MIELLLPSSLPVAAVKLALTLLLVNPYNQCLSLALEE
jgi:hypothetical protein